MHVMWVKRFIYFQHIRRPAEMGDPDRPAFAAQSMDFAATAEVFYADPHRMAW